MSEKTAEQAMNNALASVNMEGLFVDEQSQTWCKMLLLNEITMEKYIELVKEKAGIV